MVLNRHFLLHAAIVLCSAVLFHSKVVAQAPASADTGFTRSLDSAWQRHPWFVSEKNRLAQLDARRQQASSWFAGPGVISLAHGTDLIGSRNGRRDFEIETSAPLWNGGLRGATKSQIERDFAQLNAQGQLQRYKLAGELAELMGRFALAQADLQAVQRRLTEAKLLAADVSRRVSAGESPRVDSITIDSVVVNAQAAVVQAQAEVDIVAQQWTALCGLEMVSPLMTQLPARDAVHPQTTYDQSLLDNQQAKLEVAMADRRDPIEVGIGATSERSAFGSTREKGIRLSLKIPLDSSPRNDQKIATARAELDEASAQLAQSKIQIQMQISTAQLQLKAATSAVASATARAQFALEAQQLYAKANRLGEVDLITRLRADNEKFDADLALSRSNIVLKRAQLNLQLAQGQTP